MCAIRTARWGVGRRRGCGSGEEEALGGRARACHQDLGAGEAIVVGLYTPTTMGHVDEAL